MRLNFVRYASFKTRAWDLGIFTQSLWTTLYAGKFLYHTCELCVNPTGAFFGVHFSPIMFLILPLYRIATHPGTLLVLQSLIMASAAIPIYKLAKENAGGRVVGLVFAVAYLIYPATQFVNWYDFHVQAFLPLFLVYNIYHATKGNWGRYFLFAFLALMCEEHVAFILFFVGVYIAWKYRASIFPMIRREKDVEKRLVVPFATMVIAVVWYAFTLWQRNTFFPTNPAALLGFLGSANFTIIGATDPVQIPLLIVFRPWNTILALSFDIQIKLLYLLLLFGPLAFFSFKSPSALIPTLPWFGFSLISQTLAHHVLGHQYETYVIPFIFAAAVFGIRKNFLKSGLKGMGNSLKKIVVSSVVFMIIVSPLSPVINSLYPSYTSVYIGEHERYLNQALNMVPPDASILTQDNLFPQVSDRLDAYVVPVIFLNSEISNLAVDFTNQTLDRVNYILVDNKTDPTATSLVLLLLESKPYFALIASIDQDSILLYQRMTP